MKKQYKKIYKNNKKSNFTIFLIRCFISSLILLIIIFITNTTSINTSFINDSINFTKATTSFINIFNDSRKNVTEASNNNFYDECQYVNDINYYYMSNNFVNCLKSGTVIKIIKNDRYYTVVIQTIDDYLFEYSKLASIDVSIYEYVEVDQVLGSSSYIDNRYVYNLKVCKDDKCYEYR